MAVTLKDVAEKAGVSRSAVSRAFTEGASVSAKTREKVEKAARELSYSPSLIARSLATSRTKLIGLIANNFQNPVFLEVFDLYTRSLQERGFRPLLVNMTDQTNAEASVNMLKQYSVDGVILASSTMPREFPEAFTGAGVPVVHAFGPYTPAPAVHVVGIDNVHCGALAAEALQRRGYCKPAFLGGPPQASSTQDRAKGFQRKTSELGFADLEIRFAPAYAYDAGYRAMTDLLADADVDAVFCGDDLICMGAIDAARAQGLAIPDEIGFIGFNDMAMAGWKAYDLTTIHQPLNDIILGSVDLVLSLLDQPDRPPEARMLPCHLVERATLRPSEPPPEPL